MDASRCPPIRTRFVPFAWIAEFGFGVEPGGAALIGSEFGEEGGGRHDQCHVSVPAMPGAGLAMIETEIILGAQEAFLDGPAQARCSGQFRERSAFPRMSEIVGNLVGVLEAATEKQPALETALRRPVEGQAPPVNALPRMSCVTQLSHALYRLRSTYRLFKALAGTKTMAMVMRYVHLHGDHIDKAIAALHLEGRDQTTPKLHMPLNGAEQTKAA